MDRTHTAGIERREKSFRPVREVIAEDILVWVRAAQSSGSGCGLGEKREGGEEEFCRWMDVDGGEPLVLSYIPYSPVA